MKVFPSALAVDRTPVNSYNAIMTPKEKWEKRNWFLFVIGYFAIGYVAINWINEFRLHYYDVVLPFETKIPFIPTFIFGYLLVYINIIVIYLLADEIELWRRTLVSYIFLTTLCYVIFLVFPVKMVHRPELEGWVPVNVIQALARAYFIIDRPYNALPSLHVSYPMLATFLVWRTRPVWRWILLVMTIITSVSVVLVKQHYILDVITGAAAAMITYWTVVKSECWWRRFFKES